jgi:nitrogen fixation protein FixH
MSHRFHSTAFGVAGIATALLLAAACDSQPSAGAAPAPGAAAAPAVAAAGGSQSLDIAFKTLSAPSKGDNQVEAVVKRADGTPVTDATVAVTFRMPAMPTMNMPEMHSTTPLTPQGDGRYVGTGQLEMTGTWNVTVTVSRDGAPLGSSRFTVLAK